MSDLVICPHCGESFSKKGIGSHIWRVHGDGQHFNPGKCYTDGTKQVWNKGLTRETDQTVDRISNSLERKQSELELSINDDGKLKQKWQNKRVNARAEGIECNLTYEEYCQLVSDAGLKSSQLGYTGEDYVLGRYNDSGNYEMGNCRFITQKENSDEKKERLSHKHQFSFKAFLDYYNALEKAGIDPWH
ncbi:MAG: hypothetical protein J5614_08700 [Paludibacteraceae bacterium]|nr:hypothetical protein [Paludibacteraceae bacterium]